MDLLHICFKCFMAIIFFYMFTYVICMHVYLCHLPMYFACIDLYICLFTYLLFVCIYVYMYLYMNCMHACLSLSMWLYDGPGKGLSSILQLLSAWWSPRYPGDTPVASADVPKGALFCGCCIGSNYNCPVTLFVLDYSNFALLTPRFEVMIEVILMSN